MTKIGDGLVAGGFMVWPLLLSWRPLRWTG